MKNGGLVTPLAILVSTPLYAHSGHGRAGGDFSLLHYLSEVEHVAGVVLLLAVIAVGARLLWQRHQRGRR